MAAITIFSDLLDEALSIGEELHASDAEQLEKSRALNRTTRTCTSVPARRTERRRLNAERQRVAGKRAPPGGGLSPLSDGSVREETLPDGELSPRSDETREADRVKVDHCWELVEIAKRRGAHQVMYPGLSSAAIFTNSQSGSYRCTANCLNSEGERPYIWRNDALK
jgi:hypothetical protein